IRGSSWILTPNWFEKSCKSNNQTGQRSTRPKNTDSILCGSDLRYKTLKIYGPLSFVLFKPNSYGFRIVYLDCLRINPPMNDQRIVPLAELKKPERAENRTG